MSKQVFTNNAEGALLLEATLGATSFTLGSGEGALFPAISGAQHYYVRFGTDSSNEIVRVTARTGDVFTCDAIAATWGIGTPVIQPLCAEGMGEIIGEYAFIGSGGFVNDNRLLRSDGANNDLQTTGITVDDVDNVTGMGTLDLASWDASASCTLQADMIMSDVGTTQLHQNAGHLHIRTSAAGKYIWLDSTDHLYNDFGDTCYWRDASNTQLMILQQDGDLELKVKDFIIDAGNLYITAGNATIGGTLGVSGDITQSHAGDSTIIVESTDDNAIVKLKGPSGFASRLIWNEASVDAFQLYWNGTDHFNFYADNTLNAITAQVQESTGDWTFKYNVDIDNDLTVTGDLVTSGYVSTAQLRTTDILAFTDLIFNNGYSSGGITFLTADGSIQSSGGGTFDGVLVVGDLTGMAAAQTWADDIHIGRGGNAAGLTISATSTCNIHLGDAASPERGRIQYDNNGSTNDLTTDTLYVYSGATRFLSSTSTATKFSLDVDMLQDLDVTGNVAVDGSLAVSGGNGTATISGGGNQLTFNRTGGCFIDASGTGGTLWFRTNGSTNALRLSSAQVATFYGAVDMQDELDVAGATTISNNLDITGVLKVSSGYAFTANSNANDFQIIDNGPATGMSIMASTTGISSIYFADTAENDVGQIEYWHNGNTMRFTVDGTTRAVLSSSLMQLVGSLEINGTYLQIPVKATAGNPSGAVDGWMYVNTSDNAVRVYADGDWRDLATWT